MCVEYTDEKSFGYLNFAFSVRVCACVCISLCECMRMLVSSVMLSMQSCNKSCGVWVRELRVVPGGSGSICSMFIECNWGEGEQTSWNKWSDVVLRLITNLFAI